MNEEEVIARYLAECAAPGCGKPIPTDGYAHEALCFGPDGKMEPHTYIPRSELLARAQTYLWPGPRCGASGA